MSLEIEHTLGFSPSVRPGALFLPNEPTKYISYCGANTIINDLIDPSQQLVHRRGHTSNLTCVAISHDGKYLASGERGENSDVIISDLMTGAVKYRFEEHDVAVVALAFSHDDHILATLGGVNVVNSASTSILSGSSSSQSNLNLQLILWDTSNGCIIVSSMKFSPCPLPSKDSQSPLPSLKFLGFVRDVKRRNTNNYLLASASCIALPITSSAAALSSSQYSASTYTPEGITLWSIDPYKGEMTPTKVIMQDFNAITALPSNLSSNLSSSLTSNQHNARTMLSRAITCLDYTKDELYIFAATTSGDFLKISVQSFKVIQVVSATKLFINTIVVHEPSSFNNSSYNNNFNSGPYKDEEIDHSNDKILIGCSDKTLKIYSFNGEFIGQIKMDSPVVGLSLSYDGLEVLASTSLGTVSRVNLTSLQMITVSESPGGGGKVTKIVFDQGNGGPLIVSSSNTLVNNNTKAQGWRMATASEDAVIRVWDIDEYEVMATCYPRKEQEPHARPLALVFCNLLFSGWSDGRILAHSAETGESLWVLNHAHDPHYENNNNSPGFIVEDSQYTGVTALALSGNRKFLVSGGSQGDVRVWEMRTRELIFHFKEHKLRITGIKLSHDDSIAFTSSYDRSILHWDLKQEVSLKN